MNLGDKVKLHIKRKQTFSDEVDVTDGEFIIIGIGKGLPHCFGDSSWSQGFNHFDYGEEVDGRPDIVQKGSIYVPNPNYLDEAVVKNLHYNYIVVSWEILAPPVKE